MALKLKPAMVAAAIKRGIFFEVGAIRRGGIGRLCVCVWKGRRAQEVEGGRGAERAQGSGGGEISHAWGGQWWQGCRGVACACVCMPCMHVKWPVVYVPSDVT